MSPKHPAEMGIALEARFVGNLFKRQTTVQHLLLRKLQSDADTVGEHGLAKSSLEQIGAAGHT